MTGSVKILAGVALGIALGAAGAAIFLGGPGAVDVSSSSGSRDAAPEPLYWVAPMDASYRRDKPGKSPMGMDLAPVYAQEVSSDAAGTVRISPEVVNNLGVRTALVEKRPLQTSIRTVGYVQYDEDRLIHIHPRVEGWIEKLYVKAAGDPVAQGEPLYELYSPQLVNAQEELLLALKRNNERLIQASVDRLLALQLSQAFIDQLKRERQVRQTVTFRAPQSGVVDNLNIREGFYVKPGTTLMSIGSLDDVWVEAEVFERQAALVAVGLPVTMTLDYRPGEQWRGTVDYVYPSLDEKTRTLRVRLRFDNAAGTLKPNMFAQVVIYPSTGASVVIVPRQAVIRTGSQDRVVLALGKGRFKSVAVTLGQVSEEYAQILQGVAEGDAVVVSAQFLLDSESSKGADFSRMHPGDAGDEEAPVARSTMDHHHPVEADHD
jgi:Cu(I)/Ag(I) efflux system membrane fusion protein